jgi:hypothetical protein
MSVTRSPGAAGTRGCRTGEAVKVAEKPLPAGPILAREANAQREVARIKALFLDPFMAEKAE